MLIRIKRRDFNGSPLAVNGKLLRITPHADIEVPSEFIEVLKNSGIPYTVVSAGGKTGRVIIPTTENTRVQVAVNGVTYTYPVGSPLVIPDNIKEVMITAGITLEDEYSLDVQSVAALGPNTAVMPLSAAEGADVVAFTGLTAGETVTALTPNDGRLRLNVAGTKAVRGLSAWSAGAFEFTFSTSLGRSIAVVVTVTEATALNPSSYSITDDPGKVLPGGTGYGGALYYGLQMLAPSEIPDAWVAAGIERVAVYSPDHQPTNGGLYYALRKGGVWKNWDQAVADGWLNGITIPYNNNPLIGGTENRQNPALFTSMETFWIVRTGPSSWVALFHPDNVTGYRYTQGTVRATSTDMVNWTLPATRSSVFLNAPINGIMGNGHTGYARVGLNPFPDLINPATGLPFKYVIYSLNGGGDRSTSAQWGIDDLDAGMPTQLAGFQSHGGRFSEMDPWPSLTTGLNLGLPYDPRLIRPLGDGTFSAIAGVSVVGSGNANPRAALAEVRLDSKGQRILGVAQSPFMLPDTGFRYKSVGGLTGHIVDGVLDAIYTGVSFSGDNSMGALKATARNPANTNFKDILPSTRTGGLLRNPDWTSLTVLPDEWTLHRSGTPTGSHVGFDANGWSVRVSGAASTTSEAAIFHRHGFVPAEMQIAEFIVQGQQASVSSTDRRKIAFGLATQRNVDFAAQTDMVLFANWRGSNAPTATTTYKRIVQGGTEVSWAASGRSDGLGYDATNFRREIGLRIIPASRRVILVGEAGNDLDEITLPETWDLNQRVYPFICYLATGTQAIDERARAFVYRRIPVTGTIVLQGLPDAAKVGDTKAHSPEIIGGTAPYTLTLASGSLPPGRSISGTQVTGTYSTAGSYSYTLRVTDADGLTDTLVVAETVAAAAVPFGADAFAGTAGATISGRAADVGGAWVGQSTVTNNAMAITAGGRVRVNNSSGVFNVPADPGTTDYYVEADLAYVSTVAGMSAGVAARMSSTSNTHYSARWTEGLGWRIVKAIAGTSTQLAVSAEPAFSPGQTKRIRLEVTGDVDPVLTLKVDGATVATVRDNSGTRIVTAGRAGIHSSVATTDTTGIHIDNFEARALNT